ncbi:DUF354 domain-containing protein [Halobium salinum]|uniref:DUF354 domain-containing protein n=1 Tax=Halobium salinum TaxID=1364940 RepID=UPI0022703F02|nr:DUF354 domain-containing protein [Halobium salinum]
MRIAFTIQHPSNVHFFRNAIGELREEGHEVFVFAREKSVAVPLLEAYDIDHEVLADEPDGNLDLALTQLSYEYRMWRAFRRVKPDVVMSNMGLAATHAAKLTGAEARTFIDTETENATQNKLVVPFADELYVPKWLRTDFGGRETRYDGMHEMAYTDPAWFEFDPSVLEAQGVDPDEPYYVVRFSAWEAHHDIGKRGFSPEGRERLVRELADHGTVYVSDEAEGSIPEGGEPMPVDPHEFHHLLAGADGYVGEVATTTIEAALLGTPSVRVSPFVGTDGRLIYLGDEDLVESFRPENEDAAFERAVELAADDGAKAEWGERREAFFDDAVDVTAFVVEHATRATRTGAGGRRAAAPTGADQ